MPVPHGLDGDVKFWEKIFHTYNTDHCVIHDKNNLASVFVVKQIPRGSSKKRRNYIKKNLLSVKRGLYNLGRGRVASTSLERRIIKGTPKRLRKRSYYRAARNTLRCQQGVSISTSIRQSKRYLKMIKKVLKRYKLPNELAYLPHLESGFNRRAHSKAGARGIWQLLKSNARYKGLRVSRWNDERINPYKSTVAAAKILKRLKRDHKKWPLAITAYNYGTNGMRRAIKKYGYNYNKIRKYHRTRIFGFAVKNYYPSFIAVKNIAMRAERRRYSSTPKQTRRTLAKRSSSKGRLSL